MKLWIEGFAATGESAPHSLLGDYLQARTYLEAVEIYKFEHPDSGITVGKDGVARIWGCRIFDNKEDAAKDFV